MLLGISQEMERKNMLPPSIFFTACYLPSIEAAYAALAEMSDFNVPMLDHSHTHVTFIRIDL